MDDTNHGALAGRRVLVTGGSAGIGAAVVAACVAAGARVASLSRRLPADRRGVASDVVELGADVREPDQVARAVAEAQEALGGLDALVNSAGMQRAGAIGRTGPDDWRAMFDTNVLGLLAVTKAVIPLLRRNGGGDVVNLGSMAGRRVRNVEGGVYSGTKFAVHALSEALRREVWADRIRVSVIAPGAVDTAFSSYDAAPAERARILEHKARVGLAPSDVASQVVWVLSAPADVAVHEIALTSMRQEPG